MKRAVRDVLIIGGGISGMSAAIELRKRGFEVDLCEIHPTWRAYDGAGITLGGATLRTFRTLGILDAFLEHGGLFDGVTAYRADGIEIARIPTPRIDGTGLPAGGGIMRSTLAGILATATQEAGARVMLGTTFETIEETADRVQVRFTDGATRSYDLVIGADGTFSKVREAVLPTAPRPRYSGQSVWRTVVDRPADQETTLLWIGDRIKAGMIPISVKRSYVFVNEFRATKDRLPDDRLVPDFKTLLENFSAPILVKVREETSDASMVHFRPLEGHLVPLPWHVGRVVLIGDAVHATTPHLGSGACIGIEDAIVLAEELDRDATLEECLKRWEARRWERCRMVVENSGRLGEIEMEQGDRAEHAAIMRASFETLAEPI